MPARSNILQRLVLEVHKDLGPDWTVTESRLLRDARTGEDREVDVVAESSIGGYSIMLGIEVRDRSRPADVTWVESMAQKHADLPTNKLILWSANGFTDAARRKAEALKAVAVDPVESTAVPWSSFARNLVGGFIKLVHVQFDTVIDVTLADGAGARWQAGRETILTDEVGTRAATVGAILDQVTPHLRTAVLDHAKNGAGDFHAVFTPPLPCCVVGPTGETGGVRRVIFSMATQTDTAALDTRSVLWNDAVTSIAEAQFEKGEVRVVARETANAPAEISAVQLPRPERSKGRP
ncbi:restriction endonuclease [Sorangium sp. So ce118]|uniref:restriction endonuclease n=1 Tax=Sorangium sp. So ce388 TaxID=3133309 RepID=UPI003EFD9FD5